MILNTPSDADQLALSRAKASWAVNRDEHVADKLADKLAQVEPVSKGGRGNEAVLCFLTYLANNALISRQRTLRDETMGNPDNRTNNELLKMAFVSQAKAVMLAIKRNPAIASLALVAIFFGYFGCLAQLELGDIEEHSRVGKYRAIVAASDAMNARLIAGIYYLISVVAAGFALLLTSLKGIAQVLSQGPSVDGIDIDVPVILEEARLERQARAAEKRFNDGDTTAREYRAAIGQIETRRWQLRNAAKSTS